MSVQAMSWVLDHCECGGGERNVMLSLANHADREGRYARPSKETIAREARMSPRQVQRCLKALTEAGEIECVGHYGLRNDRRVRVWEIVGMRGDIMSPRADSREPNNGETICHPVKNGHGETNRAERGDMPGSEKLPPPTPPYRRTIL